MGLVEHRQEVAEIDERIIGLIQQRIELSKMIFRDKTTEGLSISDPEQERLVLKRATDIAVKLGLDADAVCDIFKVLINMSLQRQQELQQEG
jgi:chorismate mutase